MPSINKVLILILSIALLSFFFLSTPNNVSAQADPTAGCPSGEINTAIGCIGVENQRGFTIQLLRWGMRIGGGISFLLMVYAGFLIMTSSGDPKRLTAGKELLTAAISGLLLIVGGAYVLRLIGVNILGIF